VHTTLSPAVTSQENYAGKQASYLRDVVCTHRKQREKMIEKPSSCQPCPLYTYGKYFTPDAITPNSKVLFIGQNPGPDEEAGHKLIKRHYQGYQHFDEFEQVQPQPLIGATGQLFNNRFLPLSNLQRTEVSVANAIRCRPGHSLGLPSDSLPNLTTKMKLETSDATIVKALKHCRDTHLHIPNSTQLIVTMGRYAQFAMTGIQSEETEYGHKQGVMESWRGYGIDKPHFHTFETVNTSAYHSLTQQKQIFFTMHIAALFKGENKRYFHATLQDFHKIKLLLAKQWPLPLPQWHSTPPTQWPKYAAFDTEYIPDNNELIRWSLCDTDYKLYCVEAADTPSTYGYRIPIAPNSTVLIQNALADIAHLAEITDMSTIQIEDMMLADSVLWTGEPHNLNFIASKHGAFNRYKHLAHEDGQQQLYSALDAYEPMYMWRTHFIPEFKRDTGSWNIYKKYRLPLINIINKAQQTGAKLDSARLFQVQKILFDKLEQLKEDAKDLTDDDSFNLGGHKQMKEFIYG